MDIQQTVILALTEALRNERGVLALFLSGSCAKGTADAWSDIDFVLVAEEGPTDRLAEVWRAAVSSVDEIVLWWDRNTRPALINAITSNWTRIDVVILKREQLSHHTQKDLAPLLDPGGIYDELRKTRPAPEPNTKRFAFEIEEFIRVFGLLHLVIGREEYLNGVLGLFHLRNLLVELLIAETAVPDRGGVLHLNRLITDAQKAYLRDLPPPIPERQALIDAHVAYAKAYLPRAKARATHLGLTWPKAFEDATWRKLERDVGITRSD